MKKQNQEHTRLILLGRSVLQTSDIAHNPLLNQDPSLVLGKMCTQFDRIMLDGHRMHLQEIICFLSFKPLLFSTTFLAQSKPHKIMVLDSVSWISEGAIPGKTFL